MKKTFLLAGHSGSANRGCEAIIKSTADLLKRDNSSIILSTHDSEWDNKLGVTEFNKVVPYKKSNKYDICYDVFSLIDRVRKSADLRQAYFQRDIMKYAKNSDIVLQVGGDTYCYGEPPGHIFMNKYAKKHGIKSVLWACSIGQENLTQSIIKDLMNYSLICPREKLTYELMQSIGIPKNRLLLMSDPAFTLEMKEYPLPENFKVGNTVGINISPICINNENILRMVTTTVRWILQNTDFSVALIPHVFLSDNGQDIGVLKKIKDEFEKDAFRQRICFFDDLNMSCRHLKFIISSCRFLIAARTHASIAGYSTGVPTFVLGYSSKSVGIAMDIFGDDYNKYVINYASLNTETDLIDATKVLIKNEKQIKSLLGEKTAIFKDRVYKSIDMIYGL